MANAERCVCCGVVIPEGRQVCPTCDRRNMADLKPCPFCGSEVAFLGDSQSIKCKNCGCAFIVTNPLISRLEVAEAWNRRAEDGK